MPPERARRSLPLCTALFVCLAAWVSAGPPALRETLELQRSAVLAGEGWRLLSGHLVHGHLALAVWDLGARALLGFWVERRSRAELLGALALGAICSGVAVVVLRPDLISYQGSSALASSLLVAEALRLLGRDHAASTRSLAALVLLGFAAKIVVESLTQTSPTPALAGADTIESVALAHLAGGLAGAAVRFLHDQPSCIAADTSIRTGTPGIL